jgi:hypothetical protein
MELFMQFNQCDQLTDGLSRQRDTTTTRRTIVKTGVKLAYAVPVVAATMKLSTSGALAAVSGGTTFGLVLHSCTDNVTAQIPNLPKGRFKITHDSTGTASTFTTGGNNWFVELSAFKCNGNPSANFYQFAPVSFPSDDNQYVSAAFFFYASTNPAGCTETGGECFTIEQLS